MRKFRRFGVIVLSFTIALVLIDYGCEARRRAKAGECMDTTSHNGLYRAQACITSVSGNVVFFVGRLYEARTGKLVAETTFDSMDGGVPDFMPDDHAVLFDGGGDSGLIDVPPSLLDRLRAKIP
ncbi:hypothetical protein [Paraburkholderia pallida]|uniref:Uncharacterized protein n=1 Tax=Paraburkholderia pallida TaxID=2547399 RepID=A0A4P7CY13_9BURK|nr:hypothetical protein [Paraburkholderia pallida]QBQ98923.1 hypothetical protein E1956_16855 [Paraburkholderia pallida]